MTVEQNTQNGENHQKSKIIVAAYDHLYWTLNPHYDVHGWYHQCYDGNIPSFN